jgi:hypothetical protein
MTTRFWTRKRTEIFPYVSTGFSDHLIQIGQAAGTSSPDALVKRILLDVQVDAQYGVPSTGAPGDAFGQDMDFLVCAGVMGGPTDTPLDPFVDPDHRVTLTGTLQLQRATVIVTGGVSGRQFQWRNQWELDSAGIRPTPVPGIPPLGAAALHVRDPAAYMDTALYTAVSWRVSSWLRVLYQDP